MPSPWGLARSAVKGALESGFNSALQPLLIGSDIQPFTIDFTKKSRNFMQGAVDVSDAEQVDYSQAAPTPLAMFVYASGAVNAKETNSPLFSGSIEVSVDLYLRMRWRDETGAGVEVGDTDTPMDCVEEAILRVMQGTEDLGQSIFYNGDWQSDRSLVTLFEDGFAQSSKIRLAIGVRL